MHKHNEQRDTWYHVTTPGAFELFSQKFPNIKDYWRKFIKAHEGVYKYVLICTYGTLLHTLYVCIIGMNSEENDEENNEVIVNTYPTYIICIICSVDIIAMLVNIANTIIYTRLIKKFKIQKVSRD